MAAVTGQQVLLALPLHLGRTVIAVQRGDASRHWTVAPSLPPKPPPRQGAAMRMRSNGRPSTWAISTGRGRCLRRDRHRQAAVDLAAGDTVLGLDEAVRAWTGVEKLPPDHPSHCASRRAAFADVDFGGGQQIVIALVVQRGAPSASAATGSQTAGSAEANDDASITGLPVSRLSAITSATGSPA